MMPAWKKTRYNTKSLRSRENHVRIFLSCLSNRHKVTIFKMYPFYTLLFFSFFSFSVYHRFFRSSANLIEFTKHMYSLKKFISTKNSVAWIYFETDSKFVKRFHTHQIWGFGLIMSFRVRKSMNYITAVLHFKRGDNFTFDGYANEIWSLTFVKDLNLHDIYFFSSKECILFFKV